MFSLTLFLNFNLFLLILLPWVRVFAFSSKIDKQSFSSKFISSSIFLIIFYFITNKREFFSMFNNFTVFQFLFAMLTAWLCFLSDVLIFKIKYKKIKVMDIESGNFILLFLVLFFIPIFEEIVFRGFLYFFLDDTLIGKLFYIILSSTFFGMNHLIYSKINIVTKIVWGVILSILFLLFNNIILCIISHIISNILIFFTGKILRGVK